MIPALLGLAFAIALQAQTMSGVFAGAWLLPLVAACAGSIYKQGADISRGAGWWASALWLLSIGVHTFFINPVAGGAATMWILAAPSLILLTLQKHHLRPTLYWVGGAVLLYALGIIAQEFLDMQYTTGQGPAAGRSWPVVDANNGAAILNFALIPCIAAAYYWRMWLVAVIPLAYALILTNSRAGVLALIAAGLVMLWSVNKRLTALILGVGAYLYIGLHYLMPQSIYRGIYSLFDRFPIWSASIDLLTWRGLGLGTFGHYYARVRTEYSTAGFYAHNDFLQFAIEGGVLLAIAAAFWFVVTIIKTNRNNIVPAAALLMVFLQAMIEFQFYVPAIAILIGLALTWHRYNGINKA